MKNIPFVNPRTGSVLQRFPDGFLDSMTGEWFPVIGEIPRFCELENYSQSFGFQWNTFSRIQLDSSLSSNFSEARFFGETAWSPVDLGFSNVLEVGSGAGRFTEVFLSKTTGQLYSIDYSNAVDVNRRNNSEFGDRLHLAQASIYGIPFADNSFDKVFCLGVLQHTPSFEDSVEALVRKARIGGEIVVDFYSINGWHTKIHSKYIFRPITKRLPKKTLLWLIRKNIRWMLSLFDLLCCYNLDVLTRCIPIADVRGFPKTLSPKQRLEWAVMDTFDAFSPEYDNPRRIRDVAKMFTDCKCEVTFAGFVNLAVGSCSVVRARKLA